MIGADTAVMLAFPDLGIIAGADAIAAAIKFKAQHNDFVSVSDKSDAQQAQRIEQLKKRWIGTINSSGELIRQKKLSSLLKRISKLPITDRKS